MVPRLHDSALTRGPKRPTSWPAINGGPNGDEKTANCRTQEQQEGDGHREAETDAQQAAEAHAPGDGTRRREGAQARRLIVRLTTAKQEGWRCLSATCAATSTTRRSKSRSGAIITSSTASSAR